MGSDRLPELQPETKGTHQVQQEELEALPPGVTCVTREELTQFVHTKRVASYLLGKTLGEGAFAKVKEGLHVLTGEKVAVKVIDKRKAREDVYVSRNLRREAKLLQMVCQPNIVQLLEVVETDNSYYLVTELCSGGELMEHICKHKHLGEGEVRKYVRQITLAIQHLHLAGIVHRDLKVENLLLDENMDIKIIDFGLSNMYGTPTPTNGLIMPTDHCHTQCGSPAYAAPELLGHKNYGPEVDVWSIGVNMYAMLTGSLPFTVEPFNISVLHAKMLDNKINPIPDRLSPNCRDLLQKLLTPKPEERITLAEVIKHPWLIQDLTTTLTPASYPSPSELNESILQYMTETLKFCYSDVVAAVVSNKAVKASAVYHLLVKRLQRYQRTRRKSKDFGFQRPQVQQLVQRSGRKSVEHSTLQRKESGETKIEKPSLAARRRRNVCHGEPSPANPVTIVPEFFPTKARRQSAPVTPTIRERTFSFGTHAEASPASQGSSPSSLSRPSSPPFSRTFEAGRLQDKALPGTSKHRELRRVKTAGGDLRKEIVETKVSPTRDEGKSSTLPRSRRVSPPGTTRSLTNEIDPLLQDEQLFEGRRPRTQSDANGRPRIQNDASGRFPPPLRRWETDHSDIRRPSRSRSGSRPTSLIEADENHRDYQVLQHYQPNRTGSANIANRVVKTNAFFTDVDSDLGSPVDLPAIAPPAVPTSARSRKSQTNKPFYETPIGDRNGMVTSRPGSSRRGSDDCPPFITDNIQISGDLPADAIVSEIIRVLTSLRVDDLEQKGTNTVVARWNGVIFSTEIMPTANNGHVIKFSRLSGGDMYKYKDICARVLGAISI